MSWVMTAATRWFLNAGGEGVGGGPARKTVRLRRARGHSVQGASGAVSGRLGYGCVPGWEAGGVPGSVAGRTRAVAGMVRVGPVYTPPEVRGHGYASAATAVVSQGALEGGLRE